MRFGHSVRAFAALLALGAASPSLAGAQPSADVRGPVPGDPALAGKWLAVNPPKTLKTLKDEAPPLNAKGVAEHLARMAALKAKPSLDPISTCVPHGIPRLLYAPYPFLIFEERSDVTLLYEPNHAIRIAYLNEAPKVDPDPNWQGYSVAHWDGSTLVIRTNGFNAKTWLDSTGLPHGEKLVVEERYKPVSADRIDLEIKINDPDYYTRPWSTKLTLAKQPGMKIKERVCMADHKM